MPVYAFGPEKDTRPTHGEQAVQLGNVLENVYGKYKQEKAQEDRNKLLARLPNASPLQKAQIYTQIDPKLGLEYEKQYQKQQQQSQLNQLLQQISERSQGGQGMTPETIMQTPGIGPSKQPLAPTQTPSEAQAKQSIPVQQADILQATAANPAVGRALGDIAKMGQRESIHREDFQRKIYESERDYNEKKSSEFQKRISGLRQATPQKERALSLARQSLETGELGAFSKDNLANILGRPELRTASGVGLNLAIKENLLSNLARVSAKGTNKWLETVMIGAFPQTGQSLEANLTAQEAIEAELALDKAQVEIFDQLSQEDMQRQGYVGGDIEQRVSKAMEPVENQVRDRTSYRTRVLYEKQKSPKQLREISNKKPPTGAPLTRGMFQVFLKNMGTPEKAIERAKQLGYVIYPNAKIEEFIQ